MVDILRHTPRKSFSEEFGRALGSGVSKEVSKHFENKMKKETDELSHKREMDKEEFKRKANEDLQNKKFAHEKDLAAGKSEKNPFQETYQKKLASEYAGLDEEIMKAEAGLQDIDYLESLAPEVREWGNIGLN